MNWYTTRDDCNLVHRGQNIPSGTKLFLTAEQAKLHNSDREQVVECEAPGSEKEVGVLADWIDFKGSQPKAKDDDRATEEKADGRGLGGSPHERPVQETQPRSDRRRAQNS